MEIISKSEAKRLGLKKYYTGLPCKRGHIAERYVSSPHCCVCLRLKSHRWNSAHKEQRAAYGAIYREQNRDITRTKSRETYAANPQKHIDATIRSRMKNPDKFKAYLVEYYKKNADKLRAYSAIYSATYADERRQWRIQNRKRIMRINLEWQRANSEKCRSYTKKWRTTHYQDALKHEAQYRDKNRIVLRDVWRRWKQKNPDKVAMYARTRRCRKRLSHGSHTISDIQRIFTSQNGRCAYCRSSIKKGHHVDHIHPISNGGSNLPSNLQLLCPTCNLTKRDLNPLVYARKIGLLL